MNEFIRPLSSLLDLIYPRLCAGCQTELRTTETEICTPCLYALPPTETEDKPTDNLVYRKFAGRFPISAAGSCFYFDKGSVLQEVMHTLKYAQKPLVGKVLGRHYGNLLKNQVWIKSIEAIVPVPLHSRKQAERGYNQAEWFARGLAEVLQVPVRTDIIYRLRYTESQTGKGREDRRTNVSNVFGLGSGLWKYQRRHRPLPRSVLLVDDVITTGATLEAAALALLKLGIADVAIASIAVVREE